MAKQVIKSNAIVAFVGSTETGWTTGEEVGQWLGLVQNSDITINTNRVKEEGIGLQRYAANTVVSSPDITMNMEYLFSPTFHNEKKLGLHLSAGESITTNLRNKNTNFYFLIENDDLLDGLDEVENPIPNFSGFSLIGLGNTYLNSYQVNWALGQLPKVSTSFSASNVVFKNLTSNITQIPSINPVSGNDLNAGNLNLTNANTDFVSDVVFSDFYPHIGLPQNYLFELSNLQIGGVKLDSTHNPILQSFDLSINFNRETLYKLGSNFPCNRKIKYPVNADISLSCLVSGESLIDGVTSGILNSEIDYDFDISILDIAGLSTSYIYMRNAKLESVNYTTPINDLMVFSANFSIEVSDDNGLNFITGGETIWGTISSLWSEINVSWTVF